MIRESKTASPCVEVFQVLADPIRVRLLYVLAAGERNVTELCAETGIAQSKLSHHLALMVTAGLVAKRRAGAFRYYSLGPAATVTAEGVEIKAGEYAVTIEHLGTGQEA